MNKQVSRFPLQWPAGWKRTVGDHRKNGQFKRNGEPLSVAHAVQRVLDELAKLGVDKEDVVISTNLQTRLDGFPRGGQARPADVGVAVYWQATARGKAGPMRCMAVDVYREVQDNLAAVAATLEAMRGIERHGGAVVLDRVFTGFAALPAPAAKRPWREVMGFGPDEALSPEEVRMRYRSMVGRIHPDKGGTETQMAELNRARDEAFEELF